MGCSKFIILGIFTPQNLSGSANQGFPHLQPVVKHLPSYHYPNVFVCVCSCVVYILTRYYIPIMKVNLKPAPFMDSLIF